jgi:hypothetical protein
MEQQQQWPTMVLEPMFWLLYAVQSMIVMGECCTGSCVSMCLPAGPMQLGRQQATFKMTCMHARQPAAGVSIPGLPYGKKQPSTLRSSDGCCAA